MKPKPNNLSFAIGSKHGPRSGRWIVTGTGPDVFVALAKTKFQWKMSLHASGRTHIKDIRPGYEGAAPVVKGHLGDVAVGEPPIGLLIIIPDSCLRPSSDPDRTSVPEVWFDRPEQGGMVEVAIMKWRISECSLEWPDQDKGTELKMAYLIEEDLVVGVLVRYYGKEHPSTKMIDDVLKKRLASFTPRVLDSPERRGLIMHHSTTKGFIQVLEFAID